jgi:hypothetical protein
MFCKIMFDKTVLRCTTQLGILSYRPALSLLEKTRKATLGSLAGPILGSKRETESASYRWTNRPDPIYIAELVGQVSCLGKVSTE